MIASPKPADHRGLFVIDAKVNLTDYRRACDQVDAQERAQHLDRHVAAMRRHLQQLGDKDYSRLEGLDSPDLVFMFVPVEGAFLEGLQHDGSLYDEAFRRRIIAVGPSNLLASLRLVAQIWRTEEQNRNARLIAERAGALYDKFVGFIDDMGKLGDALDRAQRVHQAALGKLAQGRGNLVRRAEQLRDVDSAFARLDSAAVLSQYARRVNEQFALVKLLANREDSTGASKFLAAEVARDSMNARLLARTLFLLVARDIPDSPLAANAYYAASLLEPDSAAQWKQQVLSEFPQSSVASWIRGEDPMLRPDYETNATLLSTTFYDGIRAWADSLRRLRTSTQRVGGVGR